jgi:hypothetical protein
VSPGNGIVAEIFITLIIIITCTQVRTVGAFRKEASAAFLGEPPSQRRKEGVLQWLYGVRKS